MSVDYDCAGVSAAPIKARVLGIVATADILAVERALIDMLHKLAEAELKDPKERIESREGLRQLTCRKAMKMGIDQYERHALRE